MLPPCKFLSIVHLFNFPMSLTFAPSDVVAAATRSHVDRVAPPVNPLTDVRRPFVSSFTGHAPTTTTWTSPRLPHQRCHDATTAPTKTITTRAILTPDQVDLINNGKPLLSTSLDIDTTGRPMETPLSVESTYASFRTFIDLMPGVWNSQRTYHYVGVDDDGKATVSDVDGTKKRTREESQTTFEVHSVNAGVIEEVLQSNGIKSSAVLNSWQRDMTAGFRVLFRTIMQSMGADAPVVSGTNLAFVPTSVHVNGLIKGDYFRDLGYEEKGPIKAQFVFSASKMQLIMTTTYTKVFSVDTITLVNPMLRLRQIINYKRPTAGTNSETIADDDDVEHQGDEKDVQQQTVVQQQRMNSSEVVLVGFGTEERGSEDQRLVQ